MIVLSFGFSFAPGSARAPAPPLWDSCLGPDRGVFAVYIEQKFDDVAVLHHIFLALGALQALGLYVRHAEIAGGKIAVFYHAGTDKDALEIRMDLAGGLRRTGAPADCPCAAFFFAVR